ncbi:hypothetical protein HPC49_17510 [Pyxidicoccus fallax]|uniref:Uncharacterized protein n=1 Tax=Pyxidicoccus fallax TaxID=394095 RepID=A0A848LNR9_9BACT|nr:hypothetical protein [Pyxidicoccus fallax]NMO19319.1 hypothetical protein [Pyxidicoccus fallax]NPC80011.1 hypothetical protein [Pyxidicoccus fallax]
MRSIDSGDARVASILVADDPALPPHDGLDLVVRLRDGRGFTLTLLTLDVLQRKLAAAPSLLVSQLVLVRQVSDEAVLHAVRSALDAGIERFGTLQPPLQQ